MKIIFVSPENSTVWNFRADLIKKLVELGHEIIVTGPDHEYLPKIEALQARLICIPMNKNGLDPIADAAYALKLFRLFRKERPDAVFCYTIKPNVYGSLAALLARVPRRLAMVEGAGWAFMPSGSMGSALAAWVARVMYRIGLLCNQSVFFLNPDDLRMFVEKRIMHKGHGILLDGIGINLDHFRFVARRLPERPTFVMVSRLLRAKGVGEFIQASRLLKTQNVQFECSLVGGVDPSPSSFARSDIDKWVADGLVSYGGTVDDIRPVMTDCDVFVLPSYYAEGLPRTILEAMATGRAIITTDMPGCRETIEEPKTVGVMDGDLIIGTNGILVKPKDVEGLQRAMKYMVANPEETQRMGTASRRYAENRFDVTRVNEKIIRQFSLGAEGGREQ